MKKRIYRIDPVGKPRMTQRDKWKKRPCVLKYHAFKDACRAHGVTLPADGDITVAFVIPMPKGWSNPKRIKHLGKPHQQKPDIDNLVKALLDAVLKEDSHVWKISAMKVWGEVGRIEILNEEPKE